MILVLFRISFHCAGSSGNTFPHNYGLIYKINVDKKQNTLFFVTNMKKEI